MVMRYHTGLGVGHAYAHGQASSNPQDSGPPAEEPDEIEAEITVEVNEEVAVASDGGGDVGDEEHREGEQDEDVNVSEGDNEEFIAMVEMYGR